MALHLPASSWTGIGSPGVAPAADCTPDHLSETVMTRPLGASGCQGSKRCTIRTGPGTGLAPNTKSTLIGRAGRPRDPSERMAR